MRTQLKDSQFTLKPSEIKKLFASAGSFRNRCILKLMAYCGLRRFEVATLTVPDIDFKGLRIRVVGKGQKLAMIPLHEEVADDLKHYLGDRLTGFIFPSRRHPNKPIAINHINKVVAKAGDNAGIKNPNPKLKHINPHILRHSCARILKDKGAPLETIQAILRHSKFETTMTTYGTKSMDKIQEDYDQYMTI